MTTKTKTKLDVHSAASILQDPVPSTDVPYVVLYSCSDRLLVSNKKSTTRHDVVLVRGLCRGQCVLVGG